MRQTPFISVVGGGAGGLALALACANAGIGVRVVDRRPSRSVIQKATGVAQGVWRQLAQFGITEKVICNAIPMKHFVFYDNDRLVANVPGARHSRENPVQRSPCVLLRRISCRMPPKRPGAWHLLKQSCRSLRSLICAYGVKPGEDEGWSIARYPQIE